MLRTSLLLTNLLFLVSCATGNFKKYSEVKNTLKPPEKGMERIYLYRNSFMGAALNPDIRLNGEVVGESIALRMDYIDKAPGNYTISVSTETENKLDFVLEEGKSSYVRFDVNLGVFVGHVVPKLIEKVKAEKEMAELSYLMPEPVKKEVKSELTTGL